MYDELQVLNLASTAAKCGKTTPYMYGTQDEGQNQMSSTRRYDQLPPEAKPVADDIDRLHLGWTYVDDDPIGDATVRVQPRHGEHLAPPRQVRKYRDSYLQGETLPPRIRTSDGAMVAGNTRTEAGRQAGLTRLPTFILDPSYENAPPQVIRQLKKLSVKTNTSHGQGLSPGEIEEAIGDITTTSDSASVIAKELGVSESTVSNVLKVKRAGERAEETGVTLGGVKESVLRIFGSASVLNFNDEPWDEFLTLARDAQLTVTEVNGIKARLARLTTDGDKEDLLTEERDLLSDRIASIQTGGNRGSSKADVFRRKTEFILADLAHPEDQVGDVNPAALDMLLKHVRKIEEALGNYKTEIYRVIESIRARG